MMIASFSVLNILNLEIQCNDTLLFSYTGCYFNGKPTCVEKSLSDRYGGTMYFKKIIQNQITDVSEKIVRMASFQMLPVIVIAGQVFVLWFSGQAHLFPDNEALMNVIGCCAQIIAGLYGITLAGYTFFLSRIDALMATDTTLDYIVESMKLRFKRLIWYITVTVATALFISVFLMYYPVESGVIPDYLYRVICNEFVLFMGFATALILYYSVGVVDPNCIEKEAKRLKKKLDFRHGPDGNVVEFISLYDQIEQRCNAILPENVLNQLHENKGRHFEYTVELLQQQNKLPKPLITDLSRIHRYYACTVNCSPMAVSREMCLLARNVLAYLDQISLQLPAKT